MIGRRLNHYKILEKLGSGGMGEVFLAEDERLGRQVALKILPPSMANDPERRQRFEREARAVARLNHPNIVTIHSVEEAQGIHFFTMELVQGKPLTKWIPRDGLAPAEWCRIAVPLCDALAAAHKEGVTHRDLKPANVMISDEGRVKVLDFGLAKLKEEEPVSDDDATALADDQLTQVGRVVGTLAYMSPEQAEGKPAHAASDVFSLGILLYQLATGKKPFKGDTHISLVSSILKDDPPSASDINPRVDAALSAIIDHCLEKDPSRRYPSAVALHSALQKYQKNLEMDEMLSSQSLLSTAWGRSASAKRAGLGKWAAALALLFVLVAAALWWALRSPSGDPASAPAQERNSLAVFYFQNMTGDPELDWLRTGLADMLVTDLSQSPHVRVLGTDRLYQVLHNLGRLDDPQVSFDLVQDVARQASVNLAVLGSFLKAGNTLRINVRLQDADSGEVLASESIEGQGDAAVFSMVDDLTRRIKLNFVAGSDSSGEADRDLASVSTESVEAYRYYLEGTGHMEKGQPRQAVPLLEKAVGLDPDFAMALAKLSVAHGNMGDDERAREYAGRSLEHVSRLTDRERYYIEGRYFSLDSQTQEQALQAYRKAVELYPDHNAARNNLALIYLDREEYGQAIRHLEELRSRSMPFPGTYASLARAYLMVDDFPKAHQVLAEYADKNPDNAPGLVSLGDLLTRWGRYDEAIETLLRAERLNPDSAQQALWAAFVMKRRWQQARAAVRAIQNNPQPGVRWTGFLFEAIQDFYRGRMEEGVSRFNAAVRIFPEGSPMALQIESIRTYVLYQAERFEEARSAGELLLPKLNNADQQAVLNGLLAFCCAHLGDAACLSERVAALSGLVDPDDPSGNRSMLIGSGMVSLIQGDYPEAIRILEEAEPLLPALDDQTADYANVWYGLGRAYWETGSKDQAAQWFRKLSESRHKRLVTPVQFVRSHYFLARYHEERGESEQARRHYQLFLDYWGEGQFDRHRVEEARSKVVE